MSDLIRLSSGKLVLVRPNFACYLQIAEFLVALTGVGLRVLKQSNVIIRNVKVSKVLASTGDAIAVQESSKVWVDHVDLSSDLDHGKDL